MTALSLTLDTPELAQAYEQTSVDRQFKSGKRLIERLGIAPGARVLDVGTGTGLLAEYVADSVGAHGSVVGVDPLPLRIEIAKRKARANLQFAVDDAFDLQQFESESFDVVYLNAVFHWFPEKLAPLRNFHRLLKRAGKLGISTGSKDHPHLVHDVQRRVLARAPFNAYLQPQQGLPHRVNPDELAALLAETGFDVQSLTVEQRTHVHPDIDAALAHFQASSFGNLFGHLPVELREQAKREVGSELEQYRTAEGIPNNTGHLVAIATKR
jgi:ubiquinone/menaquinone biosynthesis C-methylase UbiE